MGMFTALAGITVVLRRMCWSSVDGPLINGVGHLNLIKLQCPVLASWHRRSRRRDVTDDRPGDQLNALVVDCFLARQS